MNDLDICKKVADIEGIKYWNHLDKCVLKAPWGWDKELPEYNPLTDDGLCLRLIEKYGVTFNIYHDLDGIKYYYGDFWRDGERIIIPDRQDLKRFVCLYVIELNTGK